MMIVKNLVCALFSLCISSSCSYVNNTSCQASQIKAVIPFIVIDNEIIMVLSSNNKKLNFMFDSGTPKKLTTISSSSLKNLSYTVTGEVRGRSINGSIYNLKKISIESLTIDNDINLNSLDGLIVRKLPILSGGYRVDGMIGGELLYRYTVIINYKKNKIYLLSPMFDEKKYCLHKVCYVLPLNIISGMPVVTVYVGGVAVNVVIDTGLSAPMMIRGMEDNDWHKYKITKKNYKIPTQIISGYSEMDFGIVKRLSFGRLTLSNVKSLILKPSDVAAARRFAFGNVGNGILKKYSIVFDYHQNKFILSKEVDSITKCDDPVARNPNAPKKASESGPEVSPRIHAGTPS